MKKLMRQAGFTLIELLVVVAIMGILMAAGTVAFTNAQKSSRDARRESDVRSMQNAFEQYFTQNNSYYASTCADMATGFFSNNSLPTDPRAGAAYTCTPSGVVGTTATGYCTCALLEQTGKGNASDASCTYTTGASANYFCASQRQ
jgi:prepilin-type N-terminal cleavage/methylation domain-containing protein